jgi:energy-coupling factor transporter transmembrane protein EcfT
MRRNPPAWAAAAGPLLVGTLIGSLAAGRMEMGLLCLAVAAALAVALRAPWPSWRWRLSLLSSCVVGFFLNLYLTPGEPLPGWPRLLGRSATYEGRALGALLGVRLFGALAALQGLRAAWPGERAADAVARLLAPLQHLRVPVGEMRVMIGLSLRFAPMLESEARRIARVQDLRAGRAPVGAQEWLTRRRAAVVPTFVSALERAERVALAMEARGYATRPVAPPERSNPGRWWWIAAGVLIAAVALVWRA